MCDFSDSIKDNKTIPNREIVTIGGVPMVRCPVAKEFKKVDYCRNVCLYFYRVTNDFILCGVKDGKK